MNLGNGPPSFSSAGINGYDQEQFQLGAANSDAYNQPPSYGSLGYGQGNSHNQFQDVNLNRGLNQTSGPVYDTKSPSFTGLGPAQGYSHNQDPNLNSELSGQQAPPSIGAMGRADVSQPSGGVGGYSGGQGPNLSDVNRRERSQNGGLASDVVFDGPDAEEFVGMSLVGKNFKRFYPNAYYKEKDDEN